MTWPEKMLIITHHTGEPHGILGAQVAATYMTQHLGIPSIVVGVTRDFHQEKLLAFIREYYGNKERIICFSHLCGRKDLIELIKILKDAGFRTILGGPHAVQDYAGEADADRYPLRFRGLQDVVDLAFSGPVDYFTLDHAMNQIGAVRFPWHNEIFLEVDWENLHVFSDKLERLSMQVAQVLRGIGCPHARKRCIITLDRPEFIEDKNFTSEIEAFGCTFCDVARDKGFQGFVSDETVLNQVRKLPEYEGRKITFELIDEYPLIYLPRLLHDTEAEGIRLSQVNLVCRVNDITIHENVLNEILSEAGKLDVRIMFSSIGFESFSEKILRNFNKGITVEDIVKCVHILRKMKGRFGNTILYTRNEDAVHGFIHPTPWDDFETMPEMNKNIAIYQLFRDVLPEHSIPLIIHHASYLGDWIRDMEAGTDVRFKRDGTWIEWWTPITGEKSETGGKGSNE
jgi:hypothetical protein